MKTQIKINGKIDFNKLTDNLIKGIKNIQENMSALNIPEEILEREIKPFGNASHIILPKEYADKKARVIINK